MYNVIKQSTGRRRLTKTKGFILASLTVGVMALPFSVPAQITFSPPSTKYTITDLSPTSWTLSVKFPLTVSVGAFGDQNAMVLTPPPGFLPFQIYVASSGSNLFVSFDQGGNTGSFGVLDISTLSTVPTPFTYFGTIDTIPGFVYPASVTATLTQNSKVIVEVTFSNDPFLSATRLIDTLGSQTANTLLQKALNLVQRKIKHSKFLAACNDLATFVDDVNTQSSAGNITSDEQAQLLSLAGAIQLLIPGCS